MNQRDDYTDELLSAYLDDELTSDERRRVESLLGGSTEQRKTLDDMRALREGMQALSTRRLDDGFSARVIASARAAAEADGTPLPGAAEPVELPAARDEPGRYRGVIYVAVTLAAAVLLAVFWNQGEPDVRPPKVTGPQRVAQAEPGSARPAQPVMPRKDRSPTPLRGGSGPRTSDNGGGATAAADSKRTTGQVSIGQGPRPPTNRASATGPVETGHDSSGGHTNHPATAGQAARPPEGNAPRRAPGPEGSQRLLLCIDVGLTGEGVAGASFVQELAAHGITFDHSVKAGADLEKTLLESRFLEPRKAAGEGGKSGTEAGEAAQLVYVVTRGGQVDAVWRAMRSKPKLFARVELDMAVRPTDFTVFEKLRLAAGILPLGAQPPVAAPGSEDRERVLRRAVARRLVMSPTWRGVPTPRGQGAAGLASLLTGAADAGRLPVVPARDGADTRNPASTGGSQPRRLGEDLVAEVLFIVHQVPPQKTRQQPQSTKG